MGSSSQHYRDTAPASTEDWENVTAHPASTEGAYWQREARHPDWEQAVSELHWVWDLHVYGMASLFSVLSVLCLLTVLRLNAQLSERPHLSSLNIFLGILAFSRLIVLFADPYGTTQALPIVLLQVLWDLGYPCLVSAFALLQLSFVRMTQVKMTRLNDESAITIIITIHFCLIITSGVLGALQQSLRILWLLTQVAFIIWGGFLCLSSLLGCLRLLRTIVKVPLQFLRQVDPGYEITGIMPVDMFSEQSRDVQQPVPPQPRIRITDVNEQTYSYASEASLAARNDHRGIVMSPQHAETYPLNCLQPSSPTHWKPPETRSKPTTPNEDPAVIKPLIAPQRSQDQNREATVPTTVSTVQALPPPIQQLSPVAQIRVEDIQFDARKLKRQSRSRLEKQLRRLTPGHSTVVLFPDHQQNRGIHNGLRHGHHEPADTEQPSLLLQQLEYSVVTNSSDTIPPLYSISSGEKERRWNGLKRCTATDLKAHCLQETTTVVSRQDFRIPNVLGVTNAMAIKGAFSSRVTRGYWIGQVDFFSIAVRIACRKRRSSG
ncbi:uncharacterized protein TNCT_243972 [Trichonephila clavata]|uniref:Proline-rich transmembrane protein 3/4 domain-containing protein n=1 Tax=Trichonephila clavata TaxID=2740835 RepID=A0A8X6L9Q4_TRICU|nr:uncharacterized protein TNCT_243972 [Trichonephila clavata]